MSLSTVPASPLAAEIVLVAHGAPSAPEAAEAKLAAIGARIASALPADWRVRTATLAQQGALDAALDGLGQPVVFPWFMAQGWFTQTELPRRLDQIGAKARILPPLGVAAGLPDALATVLDRHIRAAGGTPAQAEAILVAHGSRRPGQAAQAVRAAASALRQRLPLRKIEVAFIEEAPFVADVARAAPRAICLPFFALAAGHVEQDIPAALAQAGFDGPLLPAFGETEDALALAEKALRDAVS